MWEDKYIFDTNIFRYMFVNDNIVSETKDDLRKKLNNIAKENIWNLYMSEITKIELEYHIKHLKSCWKEKKAKLLEKQIKLFQVIPTDNKTFYVLKNIDYITRKKLTENENPNEEKKKNIKFELFDYAIIASAIAYWWEFWIITDKLHLITANEKDFNNDVLLKIFDDISLENVWYLVQEINYKNTKKYNAINIYTISVWKLKDSFTKLWENIWFEELF